jgi:hypothetical protein
MARRMSAPADDERPYRQLARLSLQHSADRLNAIPQGRVDTAEMQCHATLAQAIASLAMAQALIEIGDALRALGEQSDG